MTDLLLCIVLLLSVELASFLVRVVYEPEEEYAVNDHEYEAEDEKSHTIVVTEPLVALLLHVHL